MRVGSKAWWVHWILACTASLALGLGQPKEAKAAVGQCVIKLLTFDFGVVDPTSDEPIDVAGELKVQCTADLGSEILVCPALGMPLLEHSPNRYIYPGAGHPAYFKYHMQYELYTDPARTQIWGHPIHAPWGHVPGYLLKIPPDSPNYRGEITVPIYARLFPKSLIGPPGDYASTLIPLLDVDTYWDEWPTSNQCSYANSDSVAYDVYRLTVKATAMESCEIAGTEAVDFGEVLLVSQAEAQGSVSVRCTMGTVFNMKFDGGQSGDIANREMRNAQGSVPYQIYGDREGRWLLGDGIVGGPIAATAQDNQPTVFPIYGRADLSRVPPAGEYSDLVRITVEY